MCNQTEVCVRVDGCHGEGPTHKEVQFWWTCYHLDKASRVLILTTRDSGSSNKNRVELQNGCLALAHSNLFIPSTLNGSCLDSQSGQQKHWYACGADRRKVGWSVYGHVLAEFSSMDRLVVIEMGILAHLSNSQNCIKSNNNKIPTYAREYI